MLEFINGEEWQVINVTTENAYLQRVKGIGMRTIRYRDMDEMPLISNVPLYNGWGSPACIIFN